MGLRIQPQSQGLTDPRLNFRLDPGEPGVLRTARARDSTLRVAEQEGRNTRRLEADALAQGRIVVQSTRQFTRTGAGSFTTTVAGRTIVQSVEPRPTPVESAQALAEARDGAQETEPEPILADVAPIEIEPPETENPLEFRAGGGIGLFNGGFRFANVDTLQLERDLIAQQAAVERALIEQQTTLTDLSDPADAAEARRELAQLRQQARSIEQEINRIRLARLAEQAQQVATSLQGATAADAAQGEAAAEPAGVGAGTQPETEFLNLIA